MKDTLNKVAMLSRTSLTDLKKILNIMRLVALTDAIEVLDENSKTLKVEIPQFGTVVINEDCDFEFIPDSAFKKDVFGLKQNPSSFLKNELKKIFKIGDSNE